jgi:hypothetical protein
MRRMSPDMSTLLCIVTVLPDRASGQVDRVARELDA